MSKLKINWTDLVIVVPLVILTSCFVYGFFYLLLEVIKYTSVNILDTSLIFSGHYRFYFNFFLAGISVLAGQYYGVFYLLSKTDLGSKLKTQVIHDNRLLVWIILFLVIKVIAILINYKLFFNQESQHLLFPLVPLVMMLLLIVLYFSTWLTLKRYLIPKLKYQMFGFVFFLGLSFGLTQIKWTNGVVLDEMALSKNIMYTHGINVPTSEIGNNIKKHTFLEPFFIGNNPKTGNVEVFYENEKLLIDHISDKLEEIRSNYRYKQKLYIGFHIDKDIPMKDLIPIFYQFYLSQTHRFSIEVKTDKYTDREYFSYYLNKLLFTNYVKTKPKKEIDFFYSNPETVNPMFVYNKANIFANNVYHTPSSILLEDTVFTTTGYLEVLSNPNINYVPTVYFIDLNITFGEYINTKSKMFNTFYTLRDQYAQKEYNTSFKELNKDDQVHVRKQYPILMHEFGFYDLNETNLNTFFKEQDSLWYATLESNN